MRNAFGGVVSLLVAILVCVPASASITFEDLPGGMEAVPDGYAGRIWSNFYGLDGTHYEYGLSGYQNAVVSPDNVVFNGSGDPAEFSQGPFDFGGLFLTAAWNDGLNIDIEGYRDGSLVYNRTVVVDTTGPTWVTLNYANVDRVRFVSYGGVQHGYNGSGLHFAMDNLSFEVAPIPAPAAVVLVGLGTGLTGWLRRRRAL